MQRTIINPPQPPDWDSDPQEAYATGKSGKPLFDTLVAELKKYGLEREELHALHFQLTTAVAERKVSEALWTKLDEKRYYDQRRAYGVLKRCAKVIRKEILDLQELHPQALTLRAAYELRNRKPASEDLHGYLSRLHADLAILETIAASAEDLSPKAPTRAGAPSKAQRNGHLFELAERLSRLLSKGRTEVAKEAVAVWAIYFNDDPIELENAVKILSRQGRRQMSRT